MWTSHRSHQSAITVNLADVLRYENHLGTATQEDEPTP